MRLKTARRYLRRNSWKKAARNLSSSAKRRWNKAKTIVLKAGLK